MKIDDNNWYSLNECSSLMKVTKETIARHLRVKRLHGVKRGPKKQWFVKGEEIKRFLKKEWNYEI